MVTAGAATPLSEKIVLYNFRNKIIKKFIGYNKLKRSIKEKHFICVKYKNKNFIF